MGPARARECTSVTPRRRLQLRPRLGIGRGAIDAHGFGIYGSVSYDWKLPIRSNAGDFVAQVEGGLGPAIARIKVDRPFMPGMFENYTVATMRVGSAFQFRARAGWIVSVQPVGFLLPLSDVKGSDAGDLNLETESGFEFSLLAGDAECCSGDCTQFNNCACTPAGNACSDSADCCFGSSCTGNICCVGQNGNCMLDTDCCSGDCKPNNTCS